MHENVRIFEKKKVLFFEGRSRVLWMCTTDGFVASRAKTCVESLGFKRDDILQKRLKI